MTETASLRDTISDGSMLPIEVVANIITPFTSEGAIDPEALRSHVVRMMANGVNVFVGSPGTGEVQSLTLSEYRQLCDVTVEAATSLGKVYAMTPELSRPEDIVAYAQEAADAGVDEIQLFQYMPGHGAQPTPDEQLEYWDAVLSKIERPVALNIHGIAGYLSHPSLLASLCNKYPVIRTVYLFRATTAAMLALRDALPRDVRTGGLILDGAVNVLLGCRVLTGAEPNVIPRTTRSLAHALSVGDVETMAVMAQRIQRLATVLQPWARPNARSIKAALNVLGLPAGSSGLRRPMSRPDQTSLSELRQSLAVLGVLEWEREATMRP